MDFGLGKVPVQEQFYTNVLEAVAVEFLEDYCVGCFMQGAVFVWGNSDNYARFYDGYNYFPHVIAHIVQTSNEWEIEYVREGSIYTFVKKGTQGNIPALREWAYNTVWEDFEPPDGILE